MFIELSVILFISINMTASAMLTQAIAEQKNLSKWSWFFAGLFFNAIALIAIAGRPAKEQDRCFHAATC